MTEYTIKHEPPHFGALTTADSVQRITKYVDHVMAEITKRDVEQVTERLHALGWVEVVRCRDCVYFDKYPNDDISVCYRFDNEQPIVEPDGFCAWSCRKDKE